MAKKTENRPIQRRTYTDEQVALALSLYSLYGSCTKVGEELRIPATTIHAWVKEKNHRADGIVNHERLAIQGQKQLQDAIGFVMGEALQQVHKRLPDASAAQSATIFGILFDKMRVLFSGQQQQNTNIYVDTSGMTDEAKIELMQRALQRKQEMEVIEATQED